MNWRIGTIVAFWFLVGVLVYVIIKNWGAEYWWEAKTWQIVAAIATWLLAGGLVFAILQVRQARKSTNAQIAVEMFSELRDYETIEKLRSIYDLKSENLKTLSSDKKKEIDYVLDRLNMLGALVVNRIVDKKLAIESYGGFSALRCWYKLCTDYIRIKQCDRGYYYENYEAFARLALEYFHEERIKIKLGELDVVKILWKNTSLQPRSLKEIKKDRKKNRTR